MTSWSDSNFCGLRGQKSERFNKMEKREMRNDIPRSPPAIWLRMGYMDTRKHGETRGFTTQSIATASSCFEKKFLAWHRARLTPLVDLELDAHGVTWLRWAFAKGVFKLLPRRLCVSRHEEVQKSSVDLNYKRCSPSAHQELEVDTQRQPFVSSPYLSLGGQKDLLLQP